MSLFSYFYKCFKRKKAKESLPGARTFWYSVQKRETPQCVCAKGSMTVEAAVIIPLFATFFSFLLFFFQIMNVQLVVQDALEKTGRELAILSARELEEPENELDYLLLAKGRLYLMLKEEDAVLRYVSGGVLGISLLMSDCEQDEIVLRANYRMHFPVKILGTREFLMSQRAYYRKWNGWKEVAEKDVTDKLIYITETGKVYHEKRSCPYLALSIRTILRRQLEHERNKSGEKYLECEICCEENHLMGSVYVTDYGDRYHDSITCSGLKRTIYQKRFSEVGGMPACTKCTK